MDTVTKTITFTIDGMDVKGCPGQTILEAAEAAGIYIPRLCYFKGLTPHGSCRVCSVKVNGRFQAACTQPIAEGIIVENETDEIKKFRRNIIDMFFVEGNHFCMFCEKSGNCELQALAYRFGILAPKYPFQFNTFEIDATHNDIFIDRNRCVLCGRCVNASREIDGKTVFDFIGRGTQKRIAYNADELSETDLAAIDKAAEVCPVGTIIKKHIGFKIPVGERLYDKQPIGSEIETQKA